jgi:hypothetical protein
MIHGMALFLSTLALMAVANGADSFNRPGLMLVG